MAEPLKNRLLRYTKKYLTEKTDPDFADAIFEAAEVVRNYNDCRNELCYKCGEYKTAHLGSCDGCRWKDGE